MRIRIPNDFIPRPYQQKYMEFYDRGGKRGIWIWPRRNGKDLTAANQTAKMAFQRVANYWHGFPTLEQGRKALWDNIRRDGKRTLETVFPGFTDPKMPGSVVKRKNEQKMELYLLNGSQWRIVGTDKVENTGAGPAGLVLSEFAQMRPTAWDFLRPMLRETGGWASFITTPRGNNHAKEVFDSAKGTDGWAWDIQTVESTDLQYESDRYPGKMLGWREMVEEERNSGMHEALIRQEYFSDWTAANVGAVYGDLMERLEKAGRILEFPHPMDGVFTSWDLGISDATAIWFWRFNESRSVDLIDHYEYTGKAVAHGMDHLELKGYKYIQHYLPHDARNRTSQTGVSTVQQFVERLGFDKVSISPSLEVHDGIEAGRWLLQQPIRIHPRCGLGIKSLREYHYKLDPEKKVFSKIPEHDWSSDSADAFRYLACVVRHTEQMTRPPAIKPASDMSTPTLGRIPLDELWRIRDEERRGRY